jgi:hypothetical protein
MARTYGGGRAVPSKLRLIQRWPRGQQEHLRRLRFYPAALWPPAPKDALDCACGLYLGGPHRLDLNPRRTYGPDHQGQTTQARRAIGSKVDTGPRTMCRSARVHPKSDPRTCASGSVGAVTRIPSSSRISGTSICWGRSPSSTCPPGQIPRVGVPAAVRAAVTELHSDSPLQDRSHHPVLTGAARSHPGRFAVCGHGSVAASGEFSPRGRLRLQAAGSLLVRTVRCRTESPWPRRR